ncbi:acyltransferase [Priestia megaterium]|uniref:Acyltransferase family protein n=2 Tax=Priestia megaterium TaxID=1404 RepID=A0A0B6AQF5_PRIM2|nr:acyltransferase family protein [Priestia megaterium]AJI22863.1 acyltransferase family protein [Priestia megaterium NBRC 15308 = ATCC 14581]KFM98208.1 acyltransferase family protein [Priestia megaterium]MDR4233407.1 acyltransferase [Priestia megaterium]MED3807083.1 acyltransferase family protein [Priestia megaterium]MED4395253.1 acyltransferase family protein [Priestia megaterium]
MAKFTFFTLVLAFFYLGFFLKKNNRIQKYRLMDRNHTTVLKSLAILMVVWGHVGATLGVSNIQFIGGVGVSLFLICSGYGLFTSYKINKEKYGEADALKDYWKKKIIKVIIPYWIVELIGLGVTHKWDIGVVIKDLFFITPATPYGWYMQYLIICYILFWAVTKLKVYILISKYNFHYYLIAGFLLWFVTESLFFANPDMPFLKARQMFSFPLGVLLSLYIDRIVEILSSKKVTVYFMLIGMFGLFVTVFSQLSLVKKLPYLISNTISLFTVLPIALSIIVITMAVPFIFQNQFLYQTGKYSYELYLIHAFSLDLIDKSIINLLEFILVTLILVIGLSKLQKIIKIKVTSNLDRRKYGRFNGGYPYKE